MKKLSYIILLAIVGVFLYSCEKDEVKVVMSSNPTASAIQGPASPAGMAFTKDDIDNSIDFEWSAADFGFQSSITYGVQIAKTDDFAGAATLFTTQELTGSAGVSDINSILLAWNLTINTEATIKCRVFAMVSPNADSAFSAVTDYTVIPFDMLVDYPMVYVPGAYQGWSPGDVNGRLYSYDFNSVYKGIIRLNGDDPAMFKITVNPNWDGPNYGGTLTAAGSGYTGALDDTGGDYAAAVGTYEFTVDVSALTIELKATNDWGIIGSATAGGWDDDTDMFYNGQRQMWEITGDFVAGEVKFRANDAWDLNYGGADGSIVAGGDNIVLDADGNYTIRLDLVKNRYSIIAN
ncbi:MAG: hypothetical protein B6I20_08720 [Bacteroidetes bacterium 4572_117]|nr:MAG: hypothetical protein B6I20_08720 [Bacteroidetes bacterium 4572_117]